MTGINTLAIIGGSSVAAVEGFVREASVTIATPWGMPSGPVHRGRIGALPVLWIARHGEPHSIAPHRIDYRANLAALQAGGATHVLALNTVGGIATDADAGTLWLPDQLIDYTSGRVASYHDGERLALEHLEFAEPYDAPLRATLHAAARNCAVDLRDGGTYGCTQGPRLETSAEIRRLQRDGCDLVGMTGMPEAALASELRLPYASVCMVVNRAAGLSAEPITMEDIRREAAGCAARVTLIVQALAAALAPDPS